jgi:hypothetical protein
MPGLAAGTRLRCRVMRTVIATRYATIRPHLDAIERIAAGDPTAGPIARLGQAERFHWLVAPSSTIIQPSAVHTGLCDDPAAELDHLVATLVD